MTHTLRANDDQVYTMESVGHALTVARCCVARSRVMILLSEAPLSAEDTDAPDDDVDDEDEPLKEFQGCLQAMGSGKIVRKLKAWRTAYCALQGSRTERNRKGMAITLTEKQEKEFRRSCPGARCPRRPGMTSRFSPIASQHC